MRKFRLPARTSPSQPRNSRCIIILFMEKRTYNTLFLIESLDGKISPGDTDQLDIDKDWPTIPGVKEGLHQYYELEQKTDLVSFNTGRVMEKVGVNSHRKTPEKGSVSFVIVDNKPHLDETGVSYLCQKSKKIYLVTTNKNHPAYKLENDSDNLSIIKYDQQIDFQDLFERLSKEGIERVTVQSGGTLNATLVRSGLIDEVLIVVAPLLVGGKDTSTLMDGESLHKTSELQNLKPLKLLESNTLDDSYVALRYKVLN